MSDVDIQNLSPDQQLRGFARSPFLRYFVLAAILNIVVIGASSPMFVYKFLNPEAVQAAEEAEKQAKMDAEAAERAEAAKNTAPPPEANAESSPAETNPNESTDPAATTKGDPEKDPAKIDPNDPRVKNPEYLENLDKQEKPPEEPNLLDLGDL